MRPLQRSDTWVFSNFAKVTRPSSLFRWLLDEGFVAVAERADILGRCREVDKSAVHAILYTDITKRHR